MGVSTVYMIALSRFTFYTILEWVSLTSQTSHHLLKGYGLHYLSLHTRACSVGTRSVVIIAFLINVSFVGLIIQNDCMMTIVNCYHNHLRSLQSFNLSDQFPT